MQIIPTYWFLSGMYLHNWLITYMRSAVPHTCTWKMCMTSQVGYLKLLISRSILSGPLDFEIKSRLYIVKIFNPQGQVNLKWIARSGPKSNLCKTFWLSLLPASLTKIRSKMKSLSSRQHFPHYKSFGDISCLGNLSFDPICTKNLMQHFPYPSDDTYKNWSRFANWL